ncbi:MAG TPA: hypothetical protein VIK04_13605 [Solirubrobacteraceae bacterium]
MGGIGERPRTGRAWASIRAVGRRATPPRDRDVAIAAAGTTVAPDALRKRLIVTLLTVLVLLLVMLVIWVRFLTWRMFTSRTYWGPARNHGR